MRDGGDGACTAWCQAAGCQAADARLPAMLWYIHYPKSHQSGVCCIKQCHRELAPNQKSLGMRDSAVTALCGADARSGQHRSVPGL